LKLRLEKTVHNEKRRKNENMPQKYKKRENAKV
jgi:hypothetical protein